MPSLHRSLRVSAAAPAAKTPGLDEFGGKPAVGLPVRHSHLHAHALGVGEQAGTGPVLVYPLLAKLNFRPFFLSDWG